MIPRLIADKKVSEGTPGFLAALVKTGFRGDVETGPGQRIVYSTDNSIYQLAPSAIVFPKDAEDIKRIAAVLSLPEHAGVSISPRGGGTGTNGQSLNTGVTVDCSRHMTRILEIDPVRRIARVEAGVVKDQLNKALKSHGLFFAPELSTSNRATVGGMISTDACGQGSVIYGKTSSHVLGLHMVLADGTLIETGAGGLAEGGKRAADIINALDQIETEVRADVARVFPQLNRFMTGYDLAHLRGPDGQINLNALLCGSEGTLGMIAEAELNLLPIPEHAALIIIRYGDFNSALEDARFLTGLNVASIETIDEKVLRLAKGDAVWSAIERFFPEGGTPANGINIVEILGSDAAALQDRLAAIRAIIGSVQDGGRLGVTVADRPADIEAVWAMRKRAVGLLGNVDGPVRPVAFVEDTAVPPENLAEYIREFRALLDGEGLDYGMFGHVDAGVLHVRPALDLTRPQHRQMVRKISDAVVALTRKYGGVLWGEHGKGMRSDYVPDYFGPLYPALQKIKSLFDPKNQMNPGKIAAPPGQDLFRIDGAPLRGEADRDLSNEIREGFGKAAFCNGNGACFDFEASNGMCPSYKATGDRVQSPKGRASLMREWLRLLALAGSDARKPTAAALPQRLWNTLNHANRSDFSHEVRAALDTCLGCRACAGQCPVKVNVPDFRAKFLEHYYGRYMHPARDLLIGRIEWLMPLMRRLRPAYNLAANTKAGSAMMRVAGLAALPPMPSTAWRKRLKSMGIKEASPQAITALAPADRKRAVVFVADAFTEGFDPATVEAAVMLALRLGFIPFLASGVVNGKPLHVNGMLGAFEKTAAKTAEWLSRLADTGAVLVGIDPSMTLVFRSEYAALETVQRRPNVMLPQEWLLTIADAPRLARPEADLRLLAHCTERSAAPGAVDQWREAFARFGLALETPSTGCCGMAGTFGHMAANRSISEKLYAMSWTDAVGKPEEKMIVMATGYSCRSQAKLVGARALQHPLAVLGQIVGAQSKAERT